MSTLAAPQNGETASTRGPQRKLRRAPVALQRLVVVDPVGLTANVLGQFNSICSTGGFSANGSAIKSSCTAKTSKGCECLCDVTSDPKRTYTIHVKDSVAGTASQVLADGTTAVVPTFTVYPVTNSGTNPDITIAGPGSSIEFGAFDPAGHGNWYVPWLILAHELCGHARLNQSYTGGTGNRPGHDSTIDTENAIGAEHGMPARGHFKDPRHGESFYNPVGNRSKVGFKQPDGQHYEVP